MPLPETPERQALTRIIRDLAIWETCLKRCAPSFAKTFILRLRDVGAINDAGATVLIARLQLAGA